MTRVTKTQQLVFGILIVGLAVFGSRFLRSQEKTNTATKSIPIVTPVADGAGSTQFDVSIRTVDKQTPHSKENEMETESDPLGEVVEQQEAKPQPKTAEQIRRKEAELKRVAEQVDPAFPSNQLAESKQNSTDKTLSQDSTIVSDQRRTATLPLQPSRRDTAEQLRELNELRQWSLRMQAQAQAQARQNAYRSQQQSYQAQRNAYEATRREMNRFHRQVGGRMAARGVQW